jgi:O-acetylserine/cysteine efflux transporter
MTHGASVGWRSLVLGQVVCGIWAFNFISGAKGTQVFSPLMFTSLRLALVLALTWPFLRGVPRDQWGRLAAVALLIGALHFTTLFASLSRSGDVTSIVIVLHTYIPMSVLLAMLLLGERAGWRTLLAIGIAFAGLCLVGFDPLVLSQPGAMCLALMSAFFQALGAVLMRRLRGVRVFSFLAWSALISLPVLALVSGLTESGQWDSIRKAGPWHWAAVVYTALGASLVGHGLFYFLVQRTRVPVLMPWMLMTPVYGIAMGILVWGDRPGFRLLAGGAIVIGALLAITLRSRNRALANPTP